MEASKYPCATVTAVMPTRTANDVIDAVFEREGANALIWKARGTLVKDSWRRSWLPAVSPARAMLQLLVPEQEVESVVATVATRGRLDLQATGAVLSSPCEQTYVGERFRLWPVADYCAVPGEALGLKNSLSAIYCIVSHQNSERVSRAAMDAGSHGPVVYYCEGRGLRDRLGWLRITKEAEKEVLMVMVDNSDADEVFNAMAKAGQLHLPGRGFMYRVPVSAGLYNLPSRVSHHQYEANMQQVINAIDHLSGHTHWRDQAVFDVGGGRGAGIELETNRGSILEDQKCVTAIVNRDDMQGLMDLLLEAGAPGLNINQARFVHRQEAEDGTSAQVNHEYSQLRCVTSASVAEQLCARACEASRAMGIEDVCLLVNEVPKVATYVPGRKNYRNMSAA